MSSTPASTDKLFENILKDKTTELPAASQEDQTTAAQAEVDDDDDETNVPATDELDMLKNRARLMGIKFSNNIGVEALKARINAKLEGDTDGEADEEPETSEDDEATNGPVEVKPEPADVPIVKSPATAPVAMTKSAAKKKKRQEMQREQMKLVRVRITNLNPAKKDLPGEIFTFANSVLGAVRKFVPYGEATDNGYHIPFCIYSQLKEREFLNIKTRKDSRGRTIVETSMAREFALEVLPTLTEGELARLAASQAAAKGME